MKKIVLMLISLFLVFSSFSMVSALDINKLPDHKFDDNITFSSV